MAERGLDIDHTTTWPWTQTYGPEVNRRLPGGSEAEIVHLAHG